MDLQSAREKMAREQVGVTWISRSSAMLLAAIFLFGIAVVPLTQCAQETREYAQGERAIWMPQALNIFRALPAAWTELRTAEGSFFFRIFAANRVLLREIALFEDQLEDDSLLGRAVRPMVQTMLDRLGVGNEQAYVGRKGWLFYRPGIDYLTGPGFLDNKVLARRAASGDEWQPAPQPDPRKALADFHRDLVRRGVTLVVMPTPIKPMIHPEMFAGGMDPANLLQNSSYKLFVRDLEEQGIAVFDVADVLMETKMRTGRSQYLATDTHWRPEAMTLYAGMLAEYLTEKDLLPRSAPLQYNTAEIAVTNFGDIAAMLQLPVEQGPYAEETVVLRQVLDADQGLWRPDPAAEVLVLGDSFSNIYSLEAMGWGESAGFVEQLALELGRPVDRITRNDSGAYATREILGRELAGGRDRLAGKQVVVYQFAVRELAVGDWKFVDMTLGEPLPERFFAPAPGEERIVKGMVASVSRVPRSGSVPYADHIMALHLVGLEEQGLRLDEPQAVVYVWSMRDNVWTPEARLRPGDEITLHLRSWDDVADRLDGINRSELDDFTLQLVEPAWGEVVQ
jgi:hypothetical protein